MSPEIIGLIGTLILVGLLFSGLYIGVVMAMVGLTGIAIIAGTGQALSVAGVAPFSFITNYSFTVAPMFMLMGNIVSEMGIGADLYYAAHRWFGQLRGGLAIATTGASALFSAITGDTMSGVIVFSKVALPEMKKFKYSNMLTTGTIAAGATLGPLIPQAWDSLFTA